MRHSTRRLLENQYADRAMIAAKYGAKYLRRWQLRYDGGWSIKEIAALEGLEPCSVVSCLAKCKQVAIAPADLDSINRRELVKYAAYKPQLAPPYAGRVWTDEEEQEFTKQRQAEEDSRRELFGITLFDECRLPMPEEKRDAGDLWLQSCLNLEASDRGVLDAAAGGGHTSVGRAA